MTVTFGSSCFLKVFSCWNDSIKKSAVLVRFVLFLRFSVLFVILQNPNILFVCMWAHAFIKHLPWSRLAATGPFSVMLSAYVHHITMSFIALFFQFAKARTASMTSLTEMMEHPHGPLWWASFQKVLLGGGGISPRSKSNEPSICRVRWEDSRRGYP